MSKQIIVGVKVSSELKKVFDEYCWENRVTKSDVLRKYIKKVTKNEKDRH